MSLAIYMFKSLRISLIQRQNLRYFQCPVWKTKSC